MPDRISVCWDIDRCSFVDPRTQYFYYKGDWRKLFPAIMNPEGDKAYIYRITAIPLRVFPF